MDEKKQTTLAVEGMTCPSCSRHVTAALEGVDGVEQVEVKQREGRVTVVHASALATKQFIDALRDAGYEARAA